MSLTGCFEPPYHHFKTPFSLDPAQMSVVTYRAQLLQKLKRDDIQFVRYGDQYTLIIPTDHYFEFNSPRLNDIAYPGLNHLATFIQTYHYDKIYVAAFTDNVGTAHHQNALSRARAEAMVTFLWAHRIPSSLLIAEGYGQRHAIGNNHWIHSSAYNRRLEIQWTETFREKPKHDAAQTEARYLTK